MKDRFEIIVKQLKYKELKINMHFVTQYTYLIHNCIITRNYITFNQIHSRNYVRKEKSAQSLANLNLNIQILRLVNEMQKSPCYSV